MSLNTVCWSVFITGLFMIIAGVGLAIWAMRGSSLVQNGGGLFAIVLAGGIFFGCYLVSPYIPHIASVAKNEYVETEATVVECVFQKTTRQSRCGYVRREHQTVRGRNEIATCKNGEIGSVDRVPRRRTCSHARKMRGGARNRKACGLFARSR